MRIGKQDAPFQSISTSDAASISVRGRDLCSEVIGVLDFTSYFWLLVTGEEPNEAQRAVTNATLAAIAEHGLVPSVVAARMTLAAAPEAFHGAVSAGLLGCGSVILGSAEAAGEMLFAAAQDCEGVDASESEEALRRVVQGFRKERIPVPGFGHPQHSAGDPRAARLIALADAHGVAGIHTELLRKLEDVVGDVVGRALPINVNGAIAAVMLDAGFPKEALKGISLLARTAGLIAHLTEERRRPIGFILAEQGAAGIQYTADD